MTRRRVAAVACAVVTAATTSGCGFGQGLYNASLPGGADLGDHPFTVTAHFRDALDLVPQAGVKVNDVAVGRVTRISVERNGRIADVSVELNGSVRLPANAVASISQTSLLGEKYVALAAPSGVAPTGRLRNGAVIGVTRTTDGVEVEQVFGALSLLLNGGGINQLHDIIGAFNRFANGHSDDIRQFLSSVTAGVTSLNKQKSSITRALDALSTLSGTLRANDKQIARILRSFAPGIAVLADEQRQVNRLLSAFGNLSAVTVSTLDASKDNIVSDLRLLAPVLQQLSAAGQALPQALQVLVTYPFPDAALKGIKGDYLNAFARTALNTPGGTIVTSNVWPGVSGSTATVAPRSVAGASSASDSASSSTSASPPVISPPPGLLPPTTSSAPGLGSTLSLPPPASTTTSSGSATSSGTTSSRTPSSGTTSGSSPSKARTSTGATSSTPSASTRRSATRGSSASAGSSASSSGGGH